MKVLLYSRNKKALEEGMDTTKGRRETSTDFRVFFLACGSLAPQDSTEGAQKAFCFVRVFRRKSTKVSRNRRGRRRKLFFLCRKSSFSNSYNSPGLLDGSELGLEKGSFSGLDEGGSGSSTSTYKSFFLKKSINCSAIFFPFKLNCQNISKKPKLRYIFPRVL